MFPSDATPPNPRTNLASYHPTRSTGSAGLIRMIQMFVRHYWAAAILGLVATVGWTIQGLGNAFYYRQVSGDESMAHQPN